MNQRPILRLVLFAIAAVSMLFTGCKPRSRVTGEMTPVYNPAIAAFTSGSISVESSIMIRLADEYKGEASASEPLKEKLFEFSPGIRGEAYWVDAQTIEFRPYEHLQAGTSYNVAFYVDKLLEVTEEMKTFRFSFSTIRQSFTVITEGFKAYPGNDLRWNQLTGRLITADIMDMGDARLLLSARQERKELPVRLEPGPDRLSFLFFVDSIERKEQPGEVVVSWNGRKQSIEIEGEEKMEIPALGDFKIVEVKVVQQPEQYVLCRFSDPLLKKQNVEGLVRLENNTSLTITIEGHELRAYPAVRQAGTLKVFVEPGIRNILGYKLPSGQIYELTFESVKPEVRLIGQGVILPTSSNLTFPFEAVNLSAVDVRIVKIFENNITQFLQVNDLRGNYQLKRAGRLILKKTIQLTSERPIDYGQWNVFSIDLSDLINPDPGSIYRVEIGFRKEYSLYPCEGQEQEKKMEEMTHPWDNEFEQELSYWDAAYGEYDDYEYYYYYDWEEMEDPCSNAYYGKRRSLARNILASDLGIIAKRGTDKSLFFAVTDLRTTDPLPDVELEVYNYQKQLITSIKTGSEGLAELSVDSQPFLLVAKRGNQRGYLKMDDGLALSMNSFDTYGSVVQKGLKGYLYGERGVWRPGDTLFLTFILEDREKNLPVNHPVSFELVNPLGQLVKKIVKTASQNGFYTFITPTDPDAPTGKWNAKISIGAVSFRQTLRIETVKPNRLKINLDFGTDFLSVSKPDTKTLLEAAWLHGAPARNLKADVLVTLSQVITKFDKYPGYIFDDPARRFSAEEQTLYEGRLDEYGKATFNTRITVHDAAPGMLRASFFTRVYEEGGEFSSDRFSINYSPFESYIGIKPPGADRSTGMLTADTSHTAGIVTVDPAGRPVSRNKLDVRIYKLDWRWWWDASEETLGNFIESEYNSLIYSGTASTTNGNGTVSFTIRSPYWGRFLLRVTDPVSGHSSGTIVYIEWPGYPGRTPTTGTGGASLLSLSADKSTVNVGEPVTVKFPTPGMGRALVTVENGTRILESWWVKISEKQTTISFMTTAEMSPNVYVCVHVLQPHAQSINDLPLRLYGVVPVLVENPETRISPLISMPDVLVPEQTVNVRVSEKDSRPMTYTLAIVDEGLLDITRFKTPDPWNVFYAREAHGVRSWDLYDEVIGAYGGKIEQVFGIGGDEQVEEGKAQVKANRFKPVVIFIGPFDLPKGRTASHTIHIPNYVGSVRTMVIAGQNGSYGFAEKTTPVRKPLMVLATLPRVVGPGEKVSLPVTIFAMEERIQAVKVIVQTNDLFHVNRESSQTVSFTEPGDQVIYFDLDVSRKTGVGKVTVTATSGSEKATYEIEIDVRNPNPPVTKFTDAVIEAGKTWTTRYEPIGIEGTNKGKLEVSGIPLVDFGRRLSYLLSYPHGCLEQITSAAFPQLFLEDVIELNESARSLARKNVQAALNKLKYFALSDGSFSLWPGDDETNDWATSYAGHFMLEAELKGVSLPPGLKQSWLKYQKKAARNWSPPRGYDQYFNYTFYDLAQAYRLYTLALANEPELGAMNRLRESTSLSTQGKWRLAASYVLAGQREVAAGIIRNIEATIDEYEGSSYTYGSPARDRAMILETLSIMGDRETAIDLVKKVAADLSGHGWMSTQTTAYSLLAVSKYAGEQGVTRQLVFDYSFNGGKTNHASTKKPVAQFDLDIIGATPGTAEISNKGEGIIFARISLEGIPETGITQEESKNLKLDVAYLNMNQEYLDISKLEQGTDFLVRVTVRNPSTSDYITNIALQQVFPSGWEIRNLRLEEGNSLYQSDSYTYQDIRDDRVYTYFNLGYGSTKTFYILLSATYQGRFYLPDVLAEAMYDGRIYARKPGRWVEVTKP